MQNRNLPQVFKTRIQMQEPSPSGITRHLTLMVDKKYKYKDCMHNFTRFIASSQVILEKWI